jgi:hypothetical protein
MSRTNYCVHQLQGLQFAMGEFAIFQAQHREFLASVPCAIELVYDNLIITTESRIAGCYE